MNKALQKRGRPKKGHDSVKADYLDIRLEAAEKETFRDAAGLAGLDLSAWVRARLRVAAKKELDRASLPVKFLTETTLPTTKPDHLIEARYAQRSRLFLRFADGFEGTWSFSRLGLDMSNIKLTTVKASPSGNSVEVKSKCGEDVQLDSSSLRACQ